MTTKFSMSDDLKTSAKPVPQHLTARYKSWKADGFDAALYAELATGQSPHSMVISCCDSRVNSTKFFNTESGDMFIHRNIANVVPACDPNGAHHSTAAALEYAVTVLKVSHLIVIGHSACGGIKGGFHQCQNTTSDDSFGSLQKWLHLVKPAYDRLDHDKPEDDQINDLEKLSVIVSLEHLMGYPFIREAVQNGTLSLHGLWHDIGSGELLSLNATDGEFIAL